MTLKEVYCINQEVCDMEGKLLHLTGGILRGRGGSWMITILHDLSDDIRMNHKNQQMS